MKRTLHPSIPSERRPDLLCLAALLLLALLFLWQVLIGGKVLLPSDVLYAWPPWRAFAAQLGIAYPYNDLIGDMVLQNYSWKSFIQESFQAGRLPLWNPYTFSGVPFLAAGQYAALYPLGVVFLVLPIAEAYGWFTALHLFLAGAFMYLFVRVLGSSWRGALIAAITFEFCSFLVVSFLWPMVLGTAIWAPLLLAIVELIVRWFERGPRFLGRLVFLISTGAIALGMQFLAGHLEISFYILFSLLFYAAARLLVLLARERNLRQVFTAGIALSSFVALGFGLAAIQLIPFLELIRENFRSGLVTYQEVIGFALPKRHLLAFLMPDVFGNPTHHTFFDLFSWQFRQFEGARDALGNSKSYPFWGIKNYVEGAAYSGILPLLLALLALLLRRDRFSWIFAGSGLFALLLAFGTPLYALFFFGIPGFDQLHTPFRWIFPLSVSLAVLAGLGADALFTAQQTPRAAIWVGRTALVGSLLLLLSLGASRILAGPSLEFAQGLLRRSESLARAFAGPAALYSYEFRNLFLLGLLLLASATLILLWGRLRQGLPVAAAGLVAADLFLFGYGFNTASDPKFLEFTPPSIEFLKSQPNLFRIVSFNYDGTLPPISWMRYGLQDIRGYDTIILGRYTRFWSLLEDPSDALTYSQINKLVKPQSLESPLLDLMNVKYVVTTQNIGLPNYREVYRGELTIYENLDALPRAFVVYRGLKAQNEREALAGLGSPTFDPKTTVILEGIETVLQPVETPSQPGQATVLRYEPNEVEVRATTPIEGYLVLSDSYFVGWRAFVDGQEVPVLRADSTYRAVSLPPGEHTVLFKYSPDSFRIGALTSLISSILVLLGLGVWVWWWSVRETAETTTLQRIAKNSLTPMVTQVLNKGLDFAFAIFMLRYLGPENAGKYAFAVLLIGYFILFVDYGLGTLLTREVAKAKEQANRYLVNTLFVRVGLFGASLPILLAVVALYAWQFKLASDTTTTIFLFAVALIPSAVSSAFSAIYSAHERMEVPALVAVLTNVLRVSLSVVALLAGYGIVGLAGVSIVVNLVTAAIFWGLVSHTFFKPRWEFDVAFEREMVKTSTPLMFNSFLSTIFFRIDVMLLQPIRGDLSVGYYTTAYKFVDGLNLIPSLFTLAIFPVMSRYAESARDSLVRAFNLALKALLLVSFPISVGTTLIAHQLILLFFGTEFEPAVLALQILIWFLPFSYVNSVTHYVLIAVNQQRFLTFAFIIGAGFNIIANLLVIPTYGFAGAAAVTIVSEIVLLVPFFYGVYKHVGAIPLWPLAWRPLLASLLMGAMLLPLREVSLVFIIPLGAAVYVAALLSLRTFTQEDISLLRSLRR